MARMPRYSSGPPTSTTAAGVTSRQVAVFDADGPGSLGLGSSHSWFLPEIGLRTLSVPRPGPVLQAARLRPAGPAGRASPHATRLERRQPSARGPPGQSEHRAAGCSGQPAAASTGGEEHHGGSAERPLPARAGRRRAGRRRTGRRPPPRREDSRARPSGAAAATGTSGTSGTAAVPRRVTGATSARGGHVRGQRVGRELRLQQHDRRAAEELGGQRHGHAGGRPARHGGRQPVHDAAAGHHDSQRGQHREQESEAGGQAGSASSRPMTARHRKLRPRAGPAAGQGREADARP